MTMRYREASTAELEAVLQVHRLAFGRGEEALLVRSLLEDPGAQPLLSVVAQSGGEVVGHALFTSVSIDGCDTPTRCAILAPLAVLPHCQRSGIGRGLIETGCGILRGRGTDRVFVLGDPLYYTRCGFAPATPQGLHAPCAIVPDEAWMVRHLTHRDAGNVSGTVRCADALSAEHFWRE